MKEIIVVCLLLSLTGCTAGMVNQSKKMLGLKIYQDSNAEQSANIRIEQAMYFGVTLYPNGCITSLQPQFQMLPEVESMGSIMHQLESKPIKYKEKLLGMPFPPKTPTNFAEFKIPADQFIAISAHTSYYNGSAYVGCSDNAIYKFSANKNYELLNNTTATHCSLVINEIVPDGERVELKSLKSLNRINEWAGCDAQLEGLK